MFPIYRPAELASRLGTTTADLCEVLHAADRCYEELILLDPSKPEKRRTVLSVRSPLRELQGRFYNRILLPSLEASPVSHGSRRGSSIKTNAAPHSDSRFIYKTDICDFFPSIHDKRVYRLFRERFGCPAAVADLCSRLCTFKHHLALGLATSPILADHLLGDVDRRIAAACKAAGLVYTRYVDDVTISGRYNLHKDKAGIDSLVTHILGDHGFSAKASKCEADRTDKTTITGVRFTKDGRMDVGKNYALELARQLRDAQSLGNDGDFNGPYYTRGQIWGRMQFVKWINPRRERGLAAQFSRVNWQRAKANAIQLGLVAIKKRVVPATGCQ